MFTELADYVLSKIGKFGNSTANTRNVQGQFIEGDDAQSFPQMQLAGFESNPPVGTKHAVLTIGGASYKVSIAEDDLVPPDASLDNGEAKLYSSAAGAVKASVVLKKDGSIVITAATKIDIVAPSDVNIAGNLNVTGNINADIDVFADSAGAPISLKLHQHLGNLAVNTAAPLPSGGGTPGPGTPASTNGSGDIIDGSSTNLSTHTHSQGNDSNGDAEVNTSGPL